jgi:RsiW-degrading membrane proteinase PrsW (M82 family)
VLAHVLRFEWRVLAHVLRFEWRVLAHVLRFEWRVLVHVFELLVLVTIIFIDINFILKFQFNVENNC